MFGWAGGKDIDAAVAWLGRQPDVEAGRIGGIGFSVGGEMMLQAAASNPRLVAVVSEGAGSRSVREDVLRGPRGWLALPEAAVQTAAVAVMSGTAPPPALDDLVRRIAPRPTFLLYAGRGVDSEELNVDFYQAALAPKTLWLIPEAGRTEAAAKKAARRPSSRRGDHSPTDAACSIPPFRPDGERLGIGSALPGPRARRAGPGPGVRSGPPCYKPGYKEGRSGRAPFAFLAVMQGVRGSPGWTRTNNPPVNRTPVPRSARADPTISSRSRGSRIT